MKELTSYNRAAGYLNKIEQMKQFVDSIANCYRS